MNEFMGCLRVDLQRAFLSPVFLTAIVGMAILLYIGVEPEIRRVLVVGGTPDIVYLYDLATFQGFSKIRP